MVTTLYLVRHGETEGSEIKRYKGSIDVPLSPRGEEQIKRSSEFIHKHIQKSNALRHTDYLKDLHSNISINRSDSAALTAVYSSSLNRALRSAEIVAEPSGLKPVVVPDLRERCFGVWEGMTFLEIKDKYPFEFEKWAGNPLRYSPPDGENTLDVRDRVIKAVEGIMDNHKTQAENIAIVAHGGVNRIMLCHFLEIPLEHIFRIEQDNAAVNIIEFWEKYPVVKLLNYNIE